MPTLLDIASEYITCSRNVDLVPSPLLLLGVLALPHFLYAYIWFYPDHWRRMFPKNAVDAFAAAGGIGKLLQLLVVLLWFSSIRAQGLCLSTSSISPQQWLLFLVMLCYGQSLNVGIFQAIGHEGVYYGFKLGHTIPWVKGWPFDTVSHPQYVGSVLSIWAFVVLVWGQAPHVPLLIVAGFWSCVYAATAVQEQHL